VRQADALDKLAAVGANGGLLDRKGEIEILNGNPKWKPKSKNFCISRPLFADISLF